MPESDSAVRVVDNPDRNRYEAYVGEELAGFATYLLAPGVAVLVHTEVHGTFRGRGLGSRLASFALGNARSRGLKIEPVCPFIAAYIIRHPEYADVVVGSGPGA